MANRVLLVVRGVMRDLRSRLRTVFGLLQMFAFLCQRRKNVVAAVLSVTVLAIYLIGFFQGLVLLLSTVILLVHYYQDSLLFFPDQPESSRIFVQAPSATGLQFENLFLKTADDERINAFFIKQSPQTLASAYTFVYFHGNAGNIGHRLQNALALHSQCKVNVFLVEYRGFGKSSGTPSERGFDIDAETAYNYLIGRGDINPHKLIVFGRSLGGAVATSLVVKERTGPKPCCLILENTFTSIPEMARIFFPVARYLPTFFFRSRFFTKDKIVHVHIPVLFLSGLADELIPSVMMSNLFSLCGSKTKHIERFQTGSHNLTWRSPGYYEAINKFLAALPPPQSPVVQLWRKPQHKKQKSWGSGLLGHDLKVDDTAGVALVDVWGKNAEEQQDDLESQHLSAESSKKTRAPSIASTIRL